VSPRPSDEAPAFSEGDRVKVRRGRLEHVGVVMPSRTGRLVLKLDNGYNLGIALGADARVEVLEKGKALLPPGRRPAPQRSDLPPVTILSTGGTIASRVDYRTGAVTSQFDADDILAAIPELAEVARYDARVLYTILSENMTPRHWVDIARAAFDAIRGGAHGIMVTHGTDTMLYTGAALAFMLRTPVPVVMVGSQRSADRPSSDNAENGVCAALAAIGDIAEVLLVMHDATSDGRCAVHRAVKARKLHTSARYAFRSVNAEPLAYAYPGERRVEFNSSYWRRDEVQWRGAAKAELQERLEPSCALVKYYPGLPAHVLEYLVDRGARGIVLEGTGLGHVSSEWVPTIRKLDVPVVMTSQCIRGRVCDRVYDTGVDLLRAGVIEGEDMLAEVALVKLMWVLGQTQDRERVRTLMGENLVGEINPRTRA